MSCSSQLKIGINIAGFRVGQTEGAPLKNKASKLRGGFGIVILLAQQKRENKRTRHSIFSLQLRKIYVGPPELVFISVDTLMCDELEMDTEDEGYTSDLEEDATCELALS